MRPSILLVAATLAACGANTGPADRVDERASPATAAGSLLDDTLHIPLGAERTGDRGRVSIRFVARLSDSRCPANAMCVWEGDASVRLMVRVGATARDTVLHTRLEPSSLKINEYVISVPGLFPYPGTVPEDAAQPVPTALVRLARP